MCTGLPSTNKEDGLVISFPKHGYSLKNLFNSPCNQLHSTMGQKRLNHLTLMALESDIVKALDFTPLIKDFATRKARRKPFKR